MGDAGRRHQILVENILVAPLEIISLFRALGIELPALPYQSPDQTIIDMQIGQFLNFADRDSGRLVKVSQLAE